MKRAALPQLRSTYVKFTHRSMSETTTTFAAPITTPDGSVRQPLIRCRTIDHPNLQSQPQQQRPRLGARAKTAWGIRGASKMAEGKRQDSATQGFVPPIETSAAAPTTNPTPQPFHKPNTSQNEEHVYVLTLGLTPSISVPLGQMREEYFPKHLNRTPAHVTLFHALPHSQIDTIKADLEAVTSSIKAYHVSTGRPFRMRRGVAVLVGSGDEQSQHLREELRERWIEWLSAQDRKGWQPHWTVMNKVDEEKKVAQAFNTIRRMLFDDVQHGKAVGLELWRYDSGDWEWIQNYEFVGGGKKSDAERGETGDIEQSRSEARGRSKSPAVLKKSGHKVADIWKSMTPKKKGQR